MDKILEFLPSGEKGYLPYYLFLVSLCFYQPIDLAARAVGGFFTKRKR